MCEPTTIMLAITAVTAVASAAEQTRQADIQQDRVEEQERLNQQDLVRQQDQIDQQARQAMNEQARQAMSDMALFDTITGEYGGGKTAERAGVVSMVQHGENLATIAGNRTGAQMENRFESLAVRSGANAKLASIQQPDWVETGLKIGAGYANYKASKAPK
jgi:hypothetical protein